jgi:hypothetical protein
MKGGTYNMKMMRAMIIGGLVFLISVFASSMASAIPMADILYLKRDVGGGIWRYNYTVYNKSDPVADAGVDLFDIFFHFDPVFTMTVASIPAGWGDEGFFSKGDDFVSFQSSSPGIPPDGTDIGPGDSLDGFVLEFSGQVGDLLAFDVLFANPSDLESPILYSGFAAPVPEPATILLMVSGLAGIGVVGRRRIRKTKR